MDLVDFVLEGRQGKKECVQLCIMYMNIQRAWIWRNNFWQADPGKNDSQWICLFLFQKEVRENKSVCSFESSMYLSRGPRYGGLFSGDSYNWQK